jgi:hypothetical protein
MDRTRARLARLPLLALSALTLAGCSLVPNMDHGSSGCQNAAGIGPRDQTGVHAAPVIPELVGLGPREAAAIAVGRGHTVVFNVQIPGYGECWCVPPPEGTVIDAWFGQHGALWLMVEGVDEGHTPDEQPATGWGCA